MKKKYLRPGVGTEYVLGELCDYLRKNSWDVTEIDFNVFQGNPYDVVKKFEGENAIYITSAHTNLTSRLAEFIVPTFPKRYPYYLSPLEFIRAIKPSLSVYIPHDLLTPYGDTNLNEFRYLGLFDYVFAPADSAALQATLGAATRVIDSGWIKHSRLKESSIKSATAKTDDPLVTVFVSLLQHLRCKYGKEGVVRYFKPLLKPGWRIKLPASEGAEEIENAFREISDLRVIPAKENSIELILESDIVVCNGASSIHAEAVLMGRPVICLLDEEGLPASEQKNKLSKLRNVFYHDYRKREPIPDSELHSVGINKKNPCAAPFDFALAEQIILSASQN